jgi:citrate lyase subunit beta/citryl-CoA lyase
MTQTSQAGEVVIRSLLFCPANEARKVAKLSLSGADAGVLDLEDAVATKEKAAARAGVRPALASLHGLLRCVRVNPLDTGFGEEDVNSAVCSDLDAIVLPKIATAQNLRRFDRLIAAAEAANGVAAGQVRVIALIETAAGICAASKIAAVGGRLLRIVFGSGDLGNDLALPMMRGDSTAALAYGRAKLVYDACAAGLSHPLDGPFLAIQDREGLIADCRVSRSLGYGGRVCIHPDQVGEANRIYAPDPAEVEFARKAIAAFDEAERRGSASVAVDGVFIDYPIVYKARRIVRLAEAIARRESGRRSGGEPQSCPEQPVSRRSK